MNVNKGNLTNECEKRKFNKDMYIMYMYM